MIGETRRRPSRAFARLYYDYPFSDFAVGAGRSSRAVRSSAGSARHKSAHGSRRTAVRRQAVRAGARRIRRRAQRGARTTTGSASISGSPSATTSSSGRAMPKTRCARIVDRARRKGEALFFYAVSSRELGDNDTYLKTIQRLITDFATETWAEDALNDLATQYIRQDEDEKADETLRELYARFPTGRYAERAAWKIGWWAYRNGNYADTTRVFARGGGGFSAVRLSADVAVLVRPRLRGAERHRPGRGPLHADRHRLPESLLRPSGDQAAGRPGRPSSRSPAGHRRPDASGASTSPRRRARRNRPRVSLPPNEAGHPRAAGSRPLRSGGRRAALRAEESGATRRRSRRRSPGSTVQQGRSASGTEQFALFRGAINAMKRAYPQYMAAGGEDLPRELLRVIFPLAHWDSDPEVRGREQHRSLPGGRAHRAGIDVRAGHQVAGESRRA